MEQKQIDRINELARKARTPEGLTEWERMEQAASRPFFGTTAKHISIMKMVL